MANVGTSAIKLIDTDGDALDDGDGLKVGQSTGVSTFTSYDQFEAPTSVGALSASTAAVTGCKEIIIQADHSNSGFVMVGSSGSSATSTQKGLKLFAGDMLTLNVGSTANIYIDASAGSQNLNVSILK
tara:strand:- start:95 stop:478 length:384 start_codon:yes stop_codon:yes gene_type:complete